MKVTVLGSGVVGLSCAYSLAASGHDVKILYAEPAEGTTSGMATAIWHVYLVDPNDQRNLRWASATLSALNSLIVEEPDAGVYLVKGVELYRTSVHVRPAWADIPPLFRMLEQSEISRHPGVRWGYEIAAPLAEMDIYLPWLRAAAQSAGVMFEQRRVDRLDDAAVGADVLVNCAGLEARRLIPDSELVPVRGQYLVLERPPGVSSDYVGDDENPRGMTYVIPRRSDVMIGGTEEFGVESLSFEESVEELIDRCSSLVPWLADPKMVRITRRVVGLRPYRRGGIYFETERLPSGTPVVHCFGHGGSGFSLSWGCAASVSKAVDEL